MEAGFGAVAFVIAMQQHKCVVAVVANPLVDRAQVNAAQQAIGIDTRSVDRLPIELIEAIGGSQSIVDVFGGGVASQARIQLDPIHKTIESSAGG